MALFEQVGRVAVAFSGVGTGFGPWGSAKQYSGGACGGECWDIVGVYVEVKHREYSAAALVVRLELVKRGKRGGKAPARRIGKSR